MPTHSGKDEKGCYMQWGGQAKYYYECGNKEAKKKAVEIIRTRLKNPTAADATSMEPIYFELFPKDTSIPVLPSSSSVPTTSFPILEQRALPSASVSQTLPFMYETSRPPEFSPTTKFIRHGGRMQRDIEAGAEQKEAAKVVAPVAKPGAKK